MTTMIRDLCLVLRGKLWRFALRRLRAIVWAADEWVLAQEKRLELGAWKPQRDPNVDRAASAAREQSRRRERPAGGVLGARAGRRASPNRLPRLRYEHGAWVEREVPGKGRSRGKEVQK